MEVLDVIKSINDIAKRFFQEGSSSGHDYSHVSRVYSLCRHLAETEPSPVLVPVLEAAALLHDLGREDERKDPSIDHAQRSAELAEPILIEVGFQAELIPPVLHAIRAHRFSGSIVPTTLEAMLLQDADRIDVAGAIGIAMTFAYGGAHDRYLYHQDDPFACQRQLDDRSYSLDHFYAKILRLPQSLHTDAGKRIAFARTAFTQSFLDQLGKEIRGEF